MNPYAAIFRGFLHAMDSPKSSVWIMAVPLPGMAPWICRGSRPGGCSWALRSNLPDGLDLRTMPPMNRCIAFTKPTWLRHRLPTHALNNGARRAGSIITIITDRMKPWTSACLPLFTARAGGLIAERPDRSPIRELGLLAESRSVVISAGVVGFGSSVVHSVDTTWPSNRSVAVYMKSISCAISSAFCMTPTQAASVRPAGPKPKTSLQHHNLCPCLPPSPMSPPRAWKPALRPGGNSRANAYGGGGGSRVRG